MSELWEFCYACFRPKTSCYCADIQQLDTGIKWIFLMHPKEARHQKTGTGRLAALSLSNAEILVGVDFSRNQRLSELLHDPLLYPVLLFPSPTALPATNTRWTYRKGNRMLAIIVIDATWFFARKILRLNKELHALDHVSFNVTRESEFDFKKQPQTGCLSTIESVYYLLEDFKTASLIDKTLPTDGLMKVFRKMVSFQLACEQSRNEQLAAELYPGLFCNRKGSNLLIK